MLKRLCLECGSGHLDGVKEIKVAGLDPTVRCKNCGWAGLQSECPVLDMTPHLEGTDANDVLARALLEQLYAELYRNIAIPVGKALKEVGLFPVKELMESKAAQRLAARLVKAGVDGAHTGIWREMAAVDEEKKNGTFDLSNESDDEGEGKEENDESRG